MDAVVADWFECFKRPLPLTNIALLKAGLSVYRKMMVGKCTLKKWPGSQCAMTHSHFEGDVMNYILSGVHLLGTPQNPTVSTKVE